jgi:hypothetical protein
VPGSLVLSFAGVRSPLGNFFFFALMMEGNPVLLGRLFRFLAANWCLLSTSASLTLSTAVRPAWIENNSASDLSAGLLETTIMAVSSEDPDEPALPVMAH